jgi:FMN-dependent NADH-azoreductase
MKLLHIDSSILGSGSVSRMLSAEIVAAQRRLHPGLEVTYRDLTAEPLSHLSPAHFAAWQAKATPQDLSVQQDPGLQQDLASDEAIIDELIAADIIVIGAPMYNFTIPTQLKAWIDRVIIGGRTFRYTESGPESLLPKGKKLIIASSRGGFYGPETPASFLEHQESYLRGAFGFIGLNDVTVIRAEGTAIGAEARAQALASAKAGIAQIAA